MQRNFIIATLTDVRDQVGGQMVDASLFQLNRDPRLAPGNEQVPLAYIWIINEFAKMVARQVEAECSVSLQTANPIGVAVVSSFAREPLMANHRSFVDIIIVRLWKKCPILQGALGPEDTAAKQAALGWQKSGDVMESDEEHVSRMAGYCAGFAAIAGRYVRSVPSSDIHARNLTCR